MFFYHVTRSRLPLLAFIVLQALLLTGCDKQADVVLIEQQMQNLQTAIKTKQFSDLKNILHTDFIANQQLDRRQALQILLVYGRQHTQLDMKIIKHSIELRNPDSSDNDRAESLLTLYIAGGIKHHLPDQNSLREVQLQWRKQSGDWQIYRAQWKE